MAVSDNKHQPKLLKPREVTVCKKLAASQLSDSQRATALLAIHEGQTQSMAAATSGLSLGQVKYIVTRFRKLGLKALAAVDEISTETVESTVESTTDKTKKKSDKKDKKKSKKDKKDKKDKNKKKDKKAKGKNKKKAKNKK